MDQHSFTNAVRSLYNIDGFLLPELTGEQQAVIWREVARRQSPATPA